jgi:hypothetical protein
MAFDSTRRSIVIFGGLPVSSLGEPGASDRLFGDTWEHIEREAALPPPPPAPLLGRLESFVIAPAVVRTGERAIGTISLSVNPDASLVVLLNVVGDLVQDTLQFDPPVTREAVEGVSRTVLRFPPHTRILQFTFRSRGGFPIPFGTPIPITATLGDSSLTATVTINP